jgi:hypothetical protein
MYRSWPAGWYLGTVQNRCAPRPLFAPAFNDDRVAVFQELARFAAGLRKGREVGRQRFQRNDPRRNGGSEVLGQKRPERLVFPRLNVARRPVVEQAQAEHVRLGLVDWNRLARRVAGTDIHAQFQLVIEPPARAEYRWLICRRRPLLADRALHRLTRHAIARNNSLLVCTLSMRVAMVS